MAHLASRPHSALAVEVQFGLRVGDRFAPALDAAPDQVLHDCVGVALGRPERQPADRPHELLELARHAGIDRPMAGIVRPRRQFMDQQRT
jgi:hypothetical protein